MGTGFRVFILCAMSFLSVSAEAGSSVTFKDRGVHKTKLEDGRYHRVYSVYVSELDWEAMTKYAQAKEWDGEGTSTTVCFFNDFRNTPDVTFSGMDFSEHYKEAWVAGYWHHANNTEIFVQYPSKKRDIGMY